MSEGWLTKKAEALRAKEQSGATERASESATATAVATEPEPAQASGLRDKAPSLKDRARQEAIDAERAHDPAEDYDITDQLDEEAIPSNEDTVDESSSHEDGVPPSESESESEPEPKGEEKPGEEPEPETETTEPSEPKLPVFDDAILARAKSMGLTEAQARRFPSPEHLAWSLGTIDFQANVRSQASQQSRAAPQPAPTSAPQPTRREPAEAEQQRDFKLEVDAAKFTEEEGYPPEVAKLARAVQAMNEHNNARIRDAEAALGDIVLQTREARKQASGDLKTWFVGKIKGLGEDYALAYGDGSEPQPNTEFAENWATLAETVGMLRRGYGDGAPPRDELFAQALRLVNPDIAQKQAEAKAKASVKNRVTKRKAEVIAKPTHRGAPGKTDERKAYETLSKGLRDAGLDGDPEEPDEF